MPARKNASWVEFDGVKHHGLYPLFGKTVRVMAAFKGGMGIKEAVMVHKIHIRTARDLLVRVGRKLCRCGREADHAGRCPGNYVRNFNHQVRSGRPVKVRTRGFRLEGERWHGGAKGACKNQ